MKILSLVRLLLLPTLVACASVPGYGAPKAPPVPQGLDFSTSATGWSMKVKLNGKEWVAASMASPAQTGRIIGAKGDESISFPFSKSKMVGGTTLKISERWVVDLMLKDDVGLWGANVGEMTVTKSDETSAEGTFFFTATDPSSGKMVVATEGTFRILRGK